jgi:hypothetical protein
MPVTRKSGQLSNTNTNVALQVVETDEDYTLELADNVVVAKGVDGNVDLTLPENPFWGESHLLVNDESASLTVKGGNHQLYDRGLLGDVTVATNSSLRVNYSTGNKWITECCPEVPQPPVT